MMGHDGDPVDLEASMPDAARVPKMRKGMAGRGKGARKSPLDIAAMETAITEALFRPGAADAGWQVDRMALVEAGNRTSSRGAFTFLVPLKNRETGERQERTVVAVSYGGERTARAWERLQRPIGVRDARAVEPPLRRAGYVPDLDLLLQTYPFDHRLPAMQALLEDPTPEVLAMLGAQGMSDPVWTATVARYHPDMRSTLEVSVRERQGAADDAIRAFIKIYRDEEKGAEATAIHAAIGAGLAERPGVIVPRVLGWVPPMRAQVLAPVAGIDLDDAMQENAPWARDGVALAARAIAALHVLPLDAAWSRPLESEAQRLETISEDLAERYPALSGRVRQVAADVAARTATGPVGTMHGDLKPSHVLVGPGEVALFDFDRAAMGDPVQDMGNLMYLLGQRLQRQQGSGEPMPEVVRAFVTAYLAEVPAAWGEVLPAWYARVALGKAAKAFRGGVETEQGVEAGIREAEDALAGRLWGAG
jgi:hypothetical protein